MVLSEFRQGRFMHTAQAAARSFLGVAMHDTSGEPAGAIRRLREIMVTAAIVVGALLMLAGSVYATLLQVSGGEAVATLWPFYLGGVVAIVLGWLNGDWQR
jgi:hypothetical protein